MTRGSAPDPAGGGGLRPQTPVIGSRSALAMSLSLCSLEKIPVSVHDAAITFCRACGYLHPIRVFIKPLLK